AAPAPTTAPVAPTAVQVGTVQHRVTAPATQAAPLADQLAGKIAEQAPALRAAGPGRHVLTLQVDPEHFGPVKVVAHISPESVRVELVGSTDAARDALQKSLPDLRRDLQASGLSSDVSLGSDGAGDRTGEPGSRGTAATRPGVRATGTDPSEPTGTAGPATASASSATGGLDLLV
ncbi:flagellar hook-length control protein FliK, partial [Cellulomonas triticagri]